MSRLFWNGGKLHCALKGWMVLMNGCRMQQEVGVLLCGQSVLASSAGACSLILD